METVSGSEELKKEYELARVAKKDAEDAQQVAFTKRKGLQTQRRQMKEQKEEAEKHLRMTKELETPRLSARCSSCSTSTSTRSGTRTTSRRRPAR